ncbi:MAG: hypothetical protein OEY56_07855 [Cyclobacteriaceae bacterium]|nr:hypothetical protein [Cyclobacteriaceae bacterium]
MILTKGFLRPQPEIKRYILIIGLLLWTQTAYIFYAFFQLYREGLRFLTGQLGDRVLLVLTPTENYIYNLFYAAIASSLGFSIAMRFTLQNFINRANRRTLSLARRTLNSEGFWTWSFLLWFGKLGSMLGIWYIIFAMQYDLDLIKEFPLMLALLPVVLFYSSWPSLYKLIRLNKAKWFFGITFVFVSMTFVFAFKNFIDYKKLNDNILSNSPQHVYDLRKPYSQSQQRIYQQSIMFDVYVVKDTISTEEPVIFFDWIENSVRLAEIQNAVKEELEKVSVYEQYQLTANLHIDERIPIRQIIPILSGFRKAGLRKIQFSTGRKYSRYPADYPLFRNSGIQKVLPLYFERFSTFLDSAEQIDLTGKRFKLSESLMYRNGILKCYNRIEINVNQEFVTLNNQSIELLDLEQIVYSFIGKYSPDYVIVLNSDDDITYGRYIEILDILWTQVDRLRNEMSLELYNQPFDYWYWEHERDTIKGQYPRNILEWTTEEQRLNELIIKAGNKH